MWCMFIRDKKLYSGLPGFFFELSPYGFQYGCGYYQASPVSVKNFRQLILDNSPEYQKAMECVKNQSIFYVYGEELKTSKYPDYPPEAQDWLNRKNIGLLTESQDIDLLMSDKLADVLAQQFLSIKPFYNMMLKAESI